MLLIYLRKNKVASLTGEKVVDEVADVSREQLMEGHLVMVRKVDFILNTIGSYQQFQVEE